MAESQASGRPDELAVRAEEAYTAGRLDDARALYLAAIGGEAQNAGFLAKLGLIEHQLGDKAGGLRRLDEAQALEPSNMMIALGRAAVLQDGGDLAEAAAVLERIVAAAPNQVAAWHRLGVCRLSLKRYELAMAAFERVLALAPDHDQACNNLGVCLEALDRDDEALARYRRAAELNPENYKAQRNVGKLLNDAGDVPGAMQATRRALAIRPDYAMAHNDLAISYEKIGESEQALAHYARAVELDPRNALVHNNLGNLHFQLGQAEPALHHLRLAVELDPSLAEALGNLGMAEGRMGDLEAAHASQARAFDANPGSPFALVGYALSCQKVCDWDRFGELLPQLETLTREELTKNRRTSISPFSTLAFPWPAELQAAVSRAASRQIENTMRGVRESLNFRFDRAALTADPGRPLRIGYMSGNFRNHALSHLFMPVFDLHNRDRVEVFTYSQGEDDGSEYRRRIEADSDVFRDQHGQSHEAIARQIHADEIDILVELHGHTDLHRLHVCALRPAPINVTYIGFPGCVGARFIDYAVTDEIVTPPAEAGIYSEALALLPDSYYVTDDTQAIDPAPVTRASCGLPIEGMVYCCFNGTYKFDARVFARWMRILQAVPGSVLWLWVEAPIVRRNLQTAAESAGVDPERLVFAERWDKARHLARLRLADLFLDTLIYNAHTTACDALWAGVPVLTLPGDTFAGRVGASLLTAMKLPELIVPDLDAYEALAIRMGRDEDLLAQVRARVAANRRSTPLFDTPRWVRALEEAYRQMWRAYRNGQWPIDRPDPA